MSLLLKELFNIRAHRHVQTLSDRGWRWVCNIDAKKKAAKNVENNQWLMPTWKLSRCH